MTPTDRLSELNELEDLAPEILPEAATLSFSGNTDALRDLFARAASVTPSKEVVPGTSMASLSAQPASTTTLAHVRLTASDGEQTISVVTDGIRLRTPGEVLVSPKRVLDILRLAPDDRVDVTVTASSVVVRSGRAMWTLAVPQGAAFHDMGLLVDVDSFEMREIPAKSFLRALQSARVAASVSNARAALMQIQVTGGTLQACDGGRLHVVRAEGLDPSVATTIPVGTADELIRALHGSDSLTMGYDDRHLVFRVGDDSIVAQRMIIPFPDVRPLLLEPKLTNTRKLVVDREELERVVRRVRVNADPDYAVVSLSPVRGPRSAEDRVLEVRARDRSGNSSVEVVECTWDGPSVSMSFNHHHLVDVLGCCVSESLVLRLGPDSKTAKHPLLLVDEQANLFATVQQVTQHWS